MYKMRAAFLGLSLLLATAASAQAPAITRNAPAQVPAPHWDITGVRLSMTPTQVASAMKAAGYALEFQSKGRSWRGEVANNVLRLRRIRIPEGEKVIRSEDYRKGQEKVNVLYAPGEAGPYVANVSYSISNNEISEVDFEVSAVKKYGKPTIDLGAKLAYCSLPEQDCFRSTQSSVIQLPSLVVVVSGSTARGVRLQQGLRATRAFQAAISFEAERLYPKKDKPSI
ncbi:MAG TPA: hypothetical protein VGC35_06055 [Allosphingosinicella sp.]|jgi:hypothetical protein